MRIAFILPSLANQGPILMVRDLIEELTKRGHYCHLFYFDDVVEVIVACAIERISFFKEPEFKRFDVVHSHLFRSDLYCAWHKKKIRRESVKLISTIHTDVYKDLKSAYGFLKATIAPPLWFWAWRKMDKIIVLSKIAKENYNKNGLNNKLLIINNGRSVPKTFESIPDVDLNKINALKQSYTVLGTVASFDKRKGLEQILKLLKDEKELAFIIVGDGLERAKLNELAVTYNIAERFFILGRRPQGFRYITEFDYYVIPSRSEGMPLAMLEAAALKTAIICSDIPVFKEIFNSSEVSFFRLDDIESLKHACQIAKLNKSSFEKNAYERYRECYSVENMTDRYVDVYTND